MQKQPQPHHRTLTAIKEADLDFERTIFPLNPNDLEDTYTSIQTRIMILQQCLAQVGFELGKNDDPEA